MFVFSYTFILKETIDFDDLIFDFSPVPKDSVPRDRLPMRDPTWFKTATRVPRIPNSMVPVPHSGLKPLQKDSYTIPNDVKMKEIYYCPIDTPYGQPSKYRDIIIIIIIIIIFI